MENAALTSVAVDYQIHVSESTIVLRVQGILIFISVITYSSRTVGSIITDSNKNTISLLVMYSKNFKRHLASQQQHPRTMPDVDDSGRCR